MDKNDPFQLLQAKNKLFDESQNLLFKRTFSKRKEELGGQKELLQEVLTRTKDYEFSVTPDHQLPTNSLKEYASSDSESETDVKKSPVENQEVIVESLSFAKLRKQLLDNLFLNGYMPNHSFSIDERNFDFHDGMYYY